MDTFVIDTATIQTRDPVKRNYSTCGNLRGKPRPRVLAAGSIEFSGTLEVHRSKRCCVGHGSDGKNEGAVHTAVRDLLGPIYGFVGDEYGRNARSHREPSRTQSGSPNRRTYTRPHQMAESRISRPDDVKVDVVQLDRR